MIVCSIELLSSRFIYNQIHHFICLHTMIFDCTEDDVLKHCCLRSHMNHIIWIDALVCNGNTLIVVLLVLVQDPLAPPDNNLFCNCLIVCIKFCFECINDLHTPHDLVCFPTIVVHLLVMHQQGGKACLGEFVEGSIGMEFSEGGDEDAGNKAIQSGCEVGHVGKMDCKGIQRGWEKIMAIPSRPITESIGAGDSKTG